MKYALLDHNHSSLSKVNYGDHIQSLAAEQFLPKVDYYIERDRLNFFSGDYAKIIMNGWFTHEPKNWPPCSKLVPLFISFHLTPNIADAFLSNRNNLSYLKEYAPIGCRDYSTLDIMRRHGIESYFSGCLTLTLDIKYRKEEKTDQVYFVDLLYRYDKDYLYDSGLKKVLFNQIKLNKLFKNIASLKKRILIDKLIPKEIQNQACYVTHLCENSMSGIDKYALARRSLDLYAKAKLVLTSRIHCALPCLALGTPVFFLLDGLEGKVGNLSRYRGLLEHLNLLTLTSEKEIKKTFGHSMNVFHPHDIDWDNLPKNPNSFNVISSELKKSCYLFVEGKYRK